MFNVLRHAETLLSIRSKGVTCLPEHHQVSNQVHKELDMHDVILGEGCYSVTYTSHLVILVIHGLKPAGVHCCSRKKATIAFLPIVLCSVML